MTAHNTYNVILITQCPSGMATTFLAARRLEHAAKMRGWQCHVEMHGELAPVDYATPEHIDRADLIIVAADQIPQAERFKGQRLYQAPIAAALPDPDAFLDQAEQAASPFEWTEASSTPTDNAAASAQANRTHIVAVTACPTGVAHTFMAAEALAEAGKKMGHAIRVETQGSVGAQDQLTADEIAAADVVILACDIEVDPTRFAGKRVYRTSTGQALKKPQLTIESALKEATVESAEATTAQTQSSQSFKEKGLYKHLLTGVSFMLPMLWVSVLLSELSDAFDIEAFDGVTLAAALMQISDGTAFKLIIPMLAGYIAYSIANRPGIAPGMIGGLLAADIGTGFIGGILAGFLAGYVAQAITRWVKLPTSVESLKPILIIPLAASLVTGLVMIYIIGDPVAQLHTHLNNFLVSMGTVGIVLIGALLLIITILAQPSTTQAQASQSFKEKGVYKHLLTGVSFMLPMVVAGGLLIALSFVFGIEAFKEKGTLAAALMQIGGGTAFKLMIPVLAGYIAYSIADRPGIAPGMIGGLLAADIGTGFIGGILAGFLAGYTGLAVSRWVKLPSSLESFKPIVIIPLVASLVTGLVMIYIIGSPVAKLNTGLNEFLASMDTANAVLLGILLGAMMCFDLGGPVNKAAYAFGVGLVSTQTYGPMAAIMASGMVPAIGMGLASLVARHKFSEPEQEAGKASLVLGFCFISEGAIPFAAKDPLRVIPCCIAGGALTGALSMLAGAKLMAPHGGIFVLLIPNAINPVLPYIGAILAGSLVTGLSYAFAKRGAAAVAVEA